MYIHCTISLIVPSCKRLNFRAETRTAIMDSRVILVLLCSFLFLAVQAQTPTAFISPADGYIAGLGSNNTAFQCTVSGTDNIIWRVDDTALNSADLANRNIMRLSDLTQQDGTVISTILIPATENNNNSSVRCIAVNLDGGPSAISETVLYLVQGILDPPGQLTIVTTENDFTRRLTWQAPLSLDITDVDPDICHYNVCTTFNQTGEKSCDNVQETVYSFLNVRVPLEFSVSAVNVVGQSSASTAFHQPCDSTTAPNVVDGDTVSTEVSFQSSGSNPSVTLSFIKNAANGDSNCFDLYQVETLPSTQGDALRPLFPTVTPGANNQEPTISLTLDSGLSKNQVYNVSIKAMNVNGENASTGRIQFSTYDIQSITISARPGALAVECTFVTGSQASICQLTVCELTQGTVEPSTCQVVRVPRNPSSPVSAKFLEGLQPGLYTVQSDSVLAEDNAGVQTQFTSEQVSVLGLVDVHVTEPPPTTTQPPVSPTASIGPTGPLGTASDANPAVIAGSIIGAIAIITIVIIVIVLVSVCLSGRSDKRGRSGSTEAVGLTSTEIWLEDTDGRGNKRLTLPATDSSTTQNTMGSKAELISSNGQPDLEIEISDPSTPDLQLDSAELKQPLDTQPNRSASPPYDSMEPHDNPRHSNPVAVVYPTMADSSRERRGSNLDNLSNEDIHEVKLTASLNNLLQEDGDPQTLSVLKSSQSEDSLLSQGSQKQALYAEIEHRNAKKPSKPAESNLVLYSEIKVEELRPVVPKKRSKAGKTWSHDSGSGSAITPTGSIERSDPRLESYHV